MPYQFAAHGILNVSCEGSLLRVDGTGPWNLESLRNSKKAAKPLIENLQQGKWGVLIILHGEPIYVPSAVEFLVESINQDRQHGRVATALLVNDCTSPAFAKLHLADIYNKAGETFEFFDDVYLAKAWLLNCIEQPGSAKNDIEN